MAGYSGRCNNTQNFLGVATTVPHLTGKPRSAGKYTQQQKDDLFVVLGRVRGGALNSRRADTKFAY
jgi:hypothetical protein